MGHRAVGDYKGDCAIPGPDARVHLTPRAWRRFPLSAGREGVALRVARAGSEVAAGRRRFLRADERALAGPPARAVGDGMG